MKTTNLIASILRSLSTVWSYQLRCNLYRLKTGDKRYGKVRPFANYMPWVKDQAFLDTYKQVFGYSLVDWYRCFELWSLVAQTQKLSGGLIEIGVWRGGTGALIAHQARLCGIEDPVYLCDTFAGVVKASREDSTYKGGEHADTSRQKVEELLSHLQLKNVKILQGIFPEDTADLVTCSQFRFCHIDVDVYQSAADIVDWIWDKLVVGGVIVFDDYGFWGCDGISKFVEEQMQLPDRMVIHNLNGHAVMFKIR